MQDDRLDENGALLDVRTTRPMKQNLTVLVYFRNCDEVKPTQ
jgi:hypothetical protein